MMNVRGDYRHSFPLSFLLEYLIFYSYMWSDNPGFIQIQCGFTIIYTTKENKFTVSHFNETLLVI